MDLLKNILTGKEISQEVNKNVFSIQAKAR